MKKEYGIKFSSDELMMQIPGQKTYYFVYEDSIQQEQNPCYNCKNKYCRSNFDCDDTCKLPIPLKDWKCCGADRKDKHNGHWITDPVLIKLPLDKRSMKKRRVKKPSVKKPIKPVPPVQTDLEKQIIEIIL